MTDDITAHLASGKKLRTRDRRDVAGLTVGADGILTGIVPMIGPCRWHADGRYTEAPGGGAGPLDLVPVPDKSSETGKTGSVVAQLSDWEAKNSCCD